MLKFLTISAIKLLKESKSREIIKKEITIASVHTIIQILQKPNAINKIVDLSLSLKIEKLKSKPVETGSQRKRLTDIKICLYHNF